MLKPSNSMPIRYWKWLKEGGRPAHGGKGVWPLPVGDNFGDWLEVTGTIIPCVNGLHLCRDQDLTKWIAPELYIAEVAGLVICQNDKVVTQKARLVKKVTAWNSRTSRLFAIDCAKAVLVHYEKRCPNDNRVRNAIHVAKLSINGRATQAELANAANTAHAAANAVYAVNTTAYAAACAAADAAARAAYAAANAAAHAAADAAYAAAYAAADAAADAAARAAARATYTQTRLLLRHIGEE